MTGDVMGRRLVETTTLGTLRVAAEQCRCALRPPGKGPEGEADAESERLAKARPAPRARLSRRARPTRKARLIAKARFAPHTRLQPWSPGSVREQGLQGKGGVAGNVCRGSRVCTECGV